MTGMPRADCFACRLLAGECLIFVCACGQEGDLWLDRRAGTLVLDHGKAVFILPREEWAAGLRSARFKLADTSLTDWLARVHGWGGPTMTGMPRAGREETPADAEARDVARAALAHMGDAIDHGRMIVCEAPDAEPGADCWNWLQDFVRLIYALIRHYRLTGLRIIFTFDTRERREDGGR